MSIEHIFEEASKLRDTLLSNHGFLSIVDNNVSYKIDIDYTIISEICDDWFDYCNAIYGQICQDMYNHCYSECLPYGTICDVNMDTFETNIICQSNLLETSITRIAIGAIIWKMTIKEYQKSLMN